MGAQEVRIFAANQTAIEFIENKDHTKKFLYY
jgi:hypothetical protein